MWYAIVLTWLSPKQTHLNIRDLLLAQILDTSGRRRNYCLHPLIQN